MFFYIGIYCFKQWELYTTAEEHELEEVKEGLAVDVDWLMLLTGDSEWISLDDGDNEWEEAEYN